MIEGDGDADGDGEHLIRIGKKMKKKVQREGEDENEEGKEGEVVQDGEGVDRKWSLTALWKATRDTARPISLRILAAIRVNEPLNPVSSLFEPATVVISGKSLIMMSMKGKMDIKEVKRCRTNNVTNNGTYGILYNFTLYYCILYNFTLYNSIFSHISSFLFILFYFRLSYNPASFFLHQFYSNIS